MEPSSQASHTSESSIYPNTRMDSSVESMGKPAQRPTWWLWLILVVLVILVVIEQQGKPADPSIADKLATGSKVDPPGVDANQIFGKLILGMKGTMPGLERALQQNVDAFAGWTSDTPFGAPISAKNPPSKRAKPQPAEDRFRAAILSSETLDAEEVAWRLADVERDLVPDSVLHDDIKVMRALVGIGPKKSAEVAEATGDDSDASSHSAVEPLKPQDIETSAREGFERRHGWFAKLALSKDDPRGSFRSSATSDGVRMLMLFALFGGLVLLAGFAGVVILILGLVMHKRIRRRFVPPSVDTEWPRTANEADQRGASSVWLETVVVFVASFLALKLGLDVLEVRGVSHRVIAWSSLIAQWAILLAIFWPLVRGMPLSRWRAEVGWHSGRGVLKEMGLGFVMYLAALPLYFIVAVVVVIVSQIIGFATGAEPPVPEGNKLTEILGQGSPGLLIMLFALATLWAPIVEETIFRGALYRHLRRRWALWVAALGSAFAFAIMHGYVLQGLIMVGTLGVIFALMREWRGSLIPSMTAHFIHNAVVLTLLLTIMSLAAP